MAKKNWLNIWLQDKQLVLLGIILLFTIISLGLTLNVQGGSAPMNTAAVTPPAPTAPVSLTIVQDVTCIQCVDVSSLGQELAQAGVNVTESTVLEIADAQSVIDTYGLTRTPAIIISAGIKEYADVNTALASFAQEASDGSLIIENYAPYVDIATRTIRGLTTVTYLSDSSCEECYDVTLHKQVLARINLGIKEEKFIDVQSTEGKALVEQYQITKVPIILLSSDAKEYPAVIQVWPTVGRTASDGTFVFEKPEVMGTYKDLGTGEVITK